MDNPKDLFEAERLAIQFCESRSIKHGTELWAKMVDAFTSGYRMRAAPNAQGAAGQDRNTFKTQDKRCDNCDQVLSKHSDQRYCNPSPAVVPEPSEQDVYRWFQESTIAHHIEEDGSHISKRAMFLAKKACEFAIISHPLTTKE